MDSPPKLQRLMVPFPLMKNDLQDFERTIVDSAVSDIPDVFREVYQAQKNHADEVSKRRQVLKDLQEKLNTVEEKREEFEEEITCLTNRILQAKESVKEKGKELKLLDSALRKSVVEIVDKTTENELLEEDIKAENRRHEEKKNKVQQYVATVAAYESSSSIGLQIQTVKEKIALLQQHKEIIDKDPEEKENMISGKSQAILTSDLEEMKNRLAASIQERDNIKIKIGQEKDNQLKILQDTQVFEKKIAAQITRQKRQLKEIQLRNKQRQTQVTQLEENIRQEIKICEASS